MANMFMDALKLEILEDCLEYIKVAFSEVDVSSISPLDLEKRCEALKDKLSELFIV